MQQPSSATADSSAVFSSPADGKKAVAVEFKQVSKSFGAHQVIQQVDLSVAVGEVVAVCGPSGSGKSTLIRLINHLETLSSGEIFIHHRPTAGLSGKALRQLRTHIGFVFQQFNLLPRLTAAENVALPLIYNGSTKKVRTELALEMLFPADEATIAIVNDMVEETRLSVASNPLTSRAG